ncbi:MAG TPA: hypothetical protein VHB79_26170 [Polyangiaceae bacterium]|nr:hypothetical protein [Polyangiaceae bacterium]
MHYRLTRFALCMLAALAGVGACKNNHIESNTTNNTNYLQAKIGKDGGWVGSPDNTLGAFIPAHAVDADIDFSVHEADDGEYPALPDGAVGKVYSFEPHGTQFHTLVDVYLPSLSPNAPYNLLHAEPGGSWETLPANSSKETVQAQTRSFSFFVLQDALLPNVGAGGQTPAPYGGSANGATGNDTGSGGYVPMNPPGTGGSATGGSPTGGSGNGSTCQADGSAPTGTTKAVGQLNDGQGSAAPMSAKDGFALLGTPGELTLVFSDAPAACGTALAIGIAARDEQSLPSGRALSQTLSVHLRADATSIEMGTTYPRMSSADHLDAIWSAVDGSCHAKPMPQQGTNSVEITAIDGTHVAGTISLEDTNAQASFSGSFDFPFCDLPTSGMATCCVQ